MIFNYPPRPSTEASQEETLYGTELDESDSEDSSEEIHDDVDGSDLEDGGFALPRHSRGPKDKHKTKIGHVAMELEGDEHYDTPKGKHVVPWEHLFEFDVTDLESILTPAKAFHKKKFELSLDPLVYVSYPIHVREDGLWRKRSKKSKKARKEVSDATASAEKSMEDQLKGISIKDKENTSGDDDDHGGMTMFNVVFVLSLPQKQADEQIRDIYEHIIKKFNKALKHAQASANYVWKESEMILLMKDKAKEDSKSFWPIVTTSTDCVRASDELAVGRDLAQVYSCSRTSRCLLGNFWQPDRHSPVWNHTTFGYFSPDSRP